MNHELPEGTDPDQQRLDVLLAQLAGEPLPPLPGNLESRVWREIRARRTQDAHRTGRGWLARLLTMRRESRMAFAGLLAAAAIGITMSWANAQNIQVDSTQQALDLKVFSVEAPSLPSTLLVRADIRR